MTSKTNIGQAFPLESLGSDIARSSFNSQSIINGLIEWDKSNEDTCMIRLAKDTAPWYEDFQIPTKKSVFTANTYMGSQKGIIYPNAFSVSSLLDVAVYGGTPSDDTDPGDVLTIRVACKDAGSCGWGGYYSPMVINWVPGINIRENNYFNYLGKVYIAINNMNSSSVNPLLDTLNFRPHITNWVLGNSYDVGDYVMSDGDVYVVINTINSASLKPSLSVDYYKTATAWVSALYISGSYVIHSGSLYLAMSDIDASMVPGISTQWKQIILIQLPSLTYFNQSNISRWHVDVDVSALIVRNSSEVKSNTKTEFYIQSSIKTKGDPSIYQRSTEVFPTCNYSYFPDDKSAIWSESMPIEGSDTSLNITQRQEYSATMIFDHTDQTNCKTINFVNYDGPDLDQGLCVYLPSEIELEGGELVLPEDGYTYEFYFRIYPNVKLTTDTITRDHIVNKAQIYVYSAPDKVHIKDNKCSTPIAKFSMARMTNFYMYAENVTIPDKPVVYRATFMYVKAQNDWITYDYYQLPDHVFVGPIGFIDPQNPGNLDFNSSELSHINPNAAFIGYETCAFPTYVDVFSHPNLSPYKPGNDTFYNRTI